MSDKKRKQYSRILLKKTIDTILLLPIFAIHWVFWAIVKIILLLRLRKIAFGIFGLFCKMTFGVFFKLYFRAEYRGLENLPAKGPYIMACNHRSVLDPPLVGLLMLSKVRFVSKIENFYIPIALPILELAEAYPVDRFADSKSAFMETFKNILRDGHAIVIFPEGTVPGEDFKLRSDLNPETGLLEGKTGTVRLSIETQAAIIPVGLSGTANAIPPESTFRRQMSIFPRYRKVIVQIGKPILPKYKSLEDVNHDKLRAETDALIKEISQLVDHSLDLVPFSLPMTEEDFNKIREHEDKYPVSKKI